MRRLLDAVVASMPGTRVAWVTTREEANLVVPEAGPPRSYDLRRLRDDLGFAHAFPIEAGMRQYVARLREQQAQGQLM